MECSGHKEQQVQIARKSIPDTESILAYSKKSKEVSVAEGKVGGDNFREVTEDAKIIKVI